MTRVDFYLLKAQGVEAQRLFACRLAEKAHRLGYKVFLRTEDLGEAQILDELLWTFRQGSFVPHVLAEMADYSLATVVIGKGPAPEEFRDLLINLALTPAPDWHECRRLAEIVPHNEASLAQGRSKYRFYQRQGAELHLHRLAA
jgi:DNA polymerase-3 subunit chi